MKIVLILMGIAILLVGIWFVMAKDLAKVAEVGDDESNEVSDEPDSTTQLANPAAVFCEEQGGKIIGITNDQGQTGYCALAEDEVCEEWRLFNEGECQELGETYVFENSQQCEQTCQLGGFHAGSCFFTGEATQGNWELAPCMIDGSTQCEDGGQCSCFCENENESVQGDLNMN